MKYQTTISKVNRLTAFFFYKNTIFQKPFTLYNFSISTSFSGSYWFDNETDHRIEQEQIGYSFY